MHRKDELKMKKNLVKIITLILSCLLLIGAAVGITAFAAEGDTVEIAMKNISYQGAIKVVYLVDTNVKDAEVGIVFDTVPEVDASIKDLNYNGNSGKWTVNEKEYTAVYSDGIFAKEYRKVITATPVIVKDEKIVTVGTTVNYSPFIYAMNRFDAEATATQDELYKSLLDYSAAVQTVLGYKDYEPDEGELKADDIETLGGWADAYYKVSLDNGNSYTYQRSADVKAARFIGDLGFKGWKDAKDNTIVGWTSLTANPGTTIATYGATTNLLDFDNITDSKLPASVVYSAKDSSATVENGKVIFSKTNGLNSNASLKFPVNADVYATTYVFEADFNLTSWDNTKDGWVLAFSMWTTSGAEIFNSTLNGDKASVVDDACTKYSVGGVKLDLNTDHHLAWTITVGADGIATAELKIDGYVYATKKGLKDYKTAFAGVRFRGGTNNGEHDCDDFSILFDNVEVYSAGAPASYNVKLDAGSGTVSTNSQNVTMGEEYTLPTPTLLGAEFAGWYSGSTKIPVSGTWSYCSVNSLVAKWNVRNELKEHNDVVLSMTNKDFTSPSSSETEVKDGTTYIFKTNYTYNGMSIPDFHQVDNSLIPAYKNSDGTYGDYTQTQPHYIKIYGTQVDVEDPAKTLETDQTWAGVSIAGGNLIYFDDNGNPVTIAKKTATNKYELLDGATLPEGKKIYFSTLTWDKTGMTFEMGVEYEIVVTAVINYKDHKVDDSTTVKVGIPTYTVTAKNLETNEVKSHTSSVGSTIWLKYNGEDSGSNKITNIQNITKFKVEYRGDGSALGNDYSIATREFAVSDFFTNNAFYICNPAVTTTDVTEITFDANGGKINGADSVKLNAAQGGYLGELPIPNCDSLEFGGWYHEDKLVSENDKWESTDDSVILKAKWKVVDVIYMPDITQEKTAWNHIDPVDTKEQTGYVDVVGTKYIINYKYTYNGLSSFTLNGTSITRLKPSDNAFGYFRYYGTASNNYCYNSSLIYVANTDIVNSKGVVVANGDTLTDTSITKATDLYYKQITYSGFTFDFGKTYNIEIVLEMDGSDKPTAQMTVVLDEKGAVPITKTLTPSSAYAGFTKLAYEVRDGGASSFKISHSMTDISYTKSTPTTSADSSRYNTPVNDNTDPYFLNPSFDINKVDAKGSKFVVQTKYTYKGFSAFKIGEDYSVTSTYKNEQAIAYIGFYATNYNQRACYTSAFPGTDAKWVDKNGNEVVDENGILKEEYRTAYDEKTFTNTDIFYSSLTWGGITFDINKTYDLSIAYIAGATTYENGVVTANGGTVTFTATADGVTNRGSFAHTGTGGCDFLHTIKGFSFMCRGLSTVSTSSEYTFKQSFENTVTAQIAGGEIATVGNLVAVKLDYANPKTNTKLVYVDKGAASYALPTPTYDGYEFTGWVYQETDKEGNVTKTPIPATGASWPYDKLVTLVATWTEKTAE